MFSAWAYRNCTPLAVHPRLANHPRNGAPYAFSTNHPSHRCGFLRHGDASTVEMYALTAEATGPCPLSMGDTQATQCAAGGVTGRRRQAPPVYLLVSLPQSLPFTPPFYLHPLPRQSVFPSSLNRSVHCCRPFHVELCLVHPY